MAQVVCTSCGREFQVRPQTPKQTYCSDRDCQRERRRLWTRAKLETDPDYRANQLAAQQAWHARHPEYWRTYRGRSVRTLHRRRQGRHVQQATRQ